MKIKMGAFVAGQEVRNRSTVIQQKTGRPVQFQLTGDVRASLLTWLERRGGTIDDYAFPSRHRSHDSREHAAICSAGRRADFCDRPSTCRERHALTTPDKGVDDLQGDGKSARMQILLGRTKIENTVRYVGVDIGAVPLRAERTEI